MLFTNLISDAIGWIYWNPERIAFTIPIIDRPVAWYGLWFVLGFFIAYFMLLPVFKKKLLEAHSYSNEEAKRDAQYLLDRLTWFVVAATIIGARLGHVFFYEWPRYREHPIEILEVWKGGLASHGAVVGILIALYLYQRLISKKFPEFTFLTILDAIVVPAALAVCFIRIGNFWNQEIVGTPSNLPWAVIFGDPADGTSTVPRHPVQLYEALAYLLCFGFLYYLWKFKNAAAYPGRLSGIFFICIFTSRFFLEFLKNPQSAMLDESFVQTGQLLSIPFIILGIFLLKYSYRGCIIR